ncbi:hypothetical protein H4R35_007182 [Dimargaris xerosporica]|nr:hypothetical protein H4R35_007182 [Dimargaris xerosporica]
MPKKFRSENTKVTAAKDRKAKAQAEQDAKKRADAERREAAEWAKGARDASRKEAELAKKAEKLAKKKEADELLKQEELAISKSKRKPKPPTATSTKPKTAVGSDKVAQRRTEKVEQYQKDTVQPVASYSASNIDDALDLMTVVNSPSATHQADHLRDPADKSKPASMGGTELDRHPERRHKAAYAAYEERELPILKQEYKGLRLTQLKQMLWKNWQKSPENPFNQAHLAYNASRQEADTLVEETRSKIESRLRVD